MIKKNKTVKSRFGKPKTPKQVLFEYVRTTCISFCIALVFTLLLFAHARSEMIKNLYVNPEIIQQANEKIAMSLVMHADLTKDLLDKNYSICMRVGNIYQMAKEYEKAQLAYEIAIKKTSPDNYLPYYKLASVLISQEKFEEAKDVINSINDINNKKLIKLKTRSYIEMGDKYYSIGKFLTAAKTYEQAKFYYDKFIIKDPAIEKSISTRIVNAYIETADIMVKSGFNSDAVRFLNYAKKYKPDDFMIKYKLAIVFSDLDPIKSVEYFETLVKEKPQEIDSGVYSKALMKSANIKDLEGDSIKAKYYRYMIHSTDIFLNNKVVYANDLDILLDKFIIKKIWFAYRLKAIFRFKNVSYTDIKNLSSDFVLRKGEKEIERVCVGCADKSHPLYSNGGVTNALLVNFKTKIFTKKELNQYKVDIYLYKDDKYKTLVSTLRVPLKSINNTK